VNVLFIGDIVGRPGRRAVRTLLPGLVERWDVDLVVANGENAAGGIGITPEVADDLFSYGIDVITSGNHVWKKKEIGPYLDEEPRILRPANYPAPAPGRGSVVVEVASRKSAAVLNLSGRVFMPGDLDCPFRCAMAETDRLRRETHVVIVDFHAEATSEKLALARYLDGRASAVIGTHTHVQTSDARVLPGGTAFISDVGMTGPTDSVIGIETGLVLERFLTQRPVRFEVASGGVQLGAALVDIDEQDGRAREIRPLLVT